MSIFVLWELLGQSQRGVHYPPATSPYNDGTITISNLTHDLQLSPMFLLTTSRRENSMLDETMVMAPRHKDPRTIRRCHLFFFSFSFWYIREQAFFFFQYRKINQCFCSQQHKLPETIICIFLLFLTFSFFKLRMPILNYNKSSKRISVKRIGSIMTWRGLAKFLYLLVESQWTFDPW